MNEIFSKMTSLGFAVMISPEVLLLGLWLAASKERGRQKAWMFLFGGLIGILALVGVGVIIGPETVTTRSWSHFTIRIVLSIVMLILGLHVLIKKADPNNKRAIRYNAEKINPLLAFCCGLVIIIPNIKITTLGLSAGGDLSAAGLSLALRIQALFIFICIGAVPLLIPAIIETIRLGASGKLIHPCFVLLEKYGKWVVAAICFILSLQFLQHALKVMP